MFVTKQKRINHLQEVIELKNAELKTLRDERHAEKKRLFAALNENLKLKTKNERTVNLFAQLQEQIKSLQVTLENRTLEAKRLKEMLTDKAVEINELESMLDDAELVQKALERDARQKRQRIYAACAKMRSQIKAQQQTIEVLRHNIHAVMATYEQCDERNRQLEALTREQGGKLEVYEKLVGEIPRHEVVSE